MHKILNIGLDFDGVITDCGKLKSINAKKLYGVVIPPEQFKKEMVVGTGPDKISLFQYRELQTIIYTTEKVGLNIEPVKDSLKYINRIISKGHKIKIITSRTTKSLEVAKKWALINNLNLEFIGLGYGISKAEAAKGLDIFIDDDLDKLKPLVNVVPHRFLLTQGYNLHVETNDIATRVDSWKDFYQQIQIFNNYNPK